MPESLIILFFIIALIFKLFYNYICEIEFKNFISLYQKINKLINSILTTNSLFLQF